MDIDDEDDEIDDVFSSDDDSQDSSSKNDNLENAKDKVEDAKNKIEDAKDLVDKIKNNSNKSGTPEGPNTGPKKENAGQNNSGNSGNSQSNGSNNAGNSSNGNSSNSGNASTGGKGTNSANSGTTGGSGSTSTGATGGSSGTAGTGSTATGSTGGVAGSGSATAGSGAAGGSSAAGASAGGATAGTSGAAAGGAAASGGAAAGGAAAGGAAAGGAAVALGPIILIIIVVILIIIMIIGILSFFIDGLGLIGEKVLQFADGLWTTVKSGFVGADEAQVKKENIIDIGTYLEQMGYELEGFGFLDSNGKNVTTEDTFEDDTNGTRKVKNSDGKVILERKITKSADGQIIEGDITNIESNCIWSYLVAENRTYLVDNKTWNVSGIWEFMFGGEDTAGSGMICLVDSSGNYIMPNLIFDLFGGKLKSISIDRENKQMIVDLDNYKYSYSLDGWTGKYGKSLEFLLTLHLATMSPEFAKEVALDSDFDAKVGVALEDITATVKLLTQNGEEITEDNYEELGFTEDEWKAIEEYNREIKTYTPYIYNVKNHWFYKSIDFSNSYEHVTNPLYPDDDSEGKFTYEYEYVGLGDDDDILANRNLIVREVRASDIYQVSEPVVEKRTYNSEELSLQTILLGGTPENENTEEKYKFYIYDGSPMSEDRTEREKRYIMQKVGAGENSKYVMDTRFFQYAFAILESVHTQDAEYILRDLKELFYNLGIEVEGQDDEEEIGELEWLLPSYTPINWDPMFNTTETELKISAKTDTKSGFEKDIDVVMPANGKVVKISDDEDGTQTVKIEFTGSDDKTLEGKTIYIRGIVSNLTVGQVYNRGTNIGKTSTKDITIIMTNKNHAVITNVDKYLYPPENN